MCVCVLFFSRFCFVFFFSKIKKPTIDQQTDSVKKQETHARAHTHDRTELETENRKGKER